MNVYDYRFICILNFFESFNKFFNIGGASDGAIIVLTKEETKYFDTFNESVFFKFCSEENSILSKANRDKQTPYYVVLKRQSYSVDDIDFIEDNDKHLGKDKRNFLPILERLSTRMTAK